MNIAQEWAGRTARFLFDKFRIGELQWVRGINRPVSFLARHWPGTGAGIVRLTGTSARVAITPAEGYVFWSGYYEPAESILMAQLLGPGDIAVDIGANVGFHVLRMASLVGQSGHVYCFEPNPKCFGRLKDNVSLNGLTNVDCFPLGLGAQTTSTTLFVNPDGRNATLVEDPANQSGEGVQVEIRTLDEVLAGQRVDFIKADIEGFELEALRGGEGIIRDYHPAMLCEYSEYYARVLGYEWRSVAAFLGGHGYRLYSMRGCLLDEVYAPGALSNFNYIGLPDARPGLLARFCGKRWGKRAAAASRTPR
jgi:FkbM family methyltransferase